MTCPVCAKKTIVIDYRSDVDCVNRKRECKSCGFRFETVEIDGDMYERIVRREPVTYRKKERG